MKRVLSAALLWVTVALLAPTRAEALRLEGWQGHLSIGYARLFSDSLAPTGSLSVAGGVDHPLVGRFRIGPVISLSLLGSSQTERGSVPAGLDYSMLDGAIMVHYLPAKGPIARISAGPGFASARAELQVAGGGAGFSDLAVGEVKPELALEITSMQRGKLVALGAELGLRLVPVDQGLWTVFTARFAIHY